MSHSGTGQLLVLAWAYSRATVVFSNGRPLTRQRLSSSVQAISACYSGSYSGHSFHIGAATTAAARGFPYQLIKTLRCWSSDAYQIYIRTTVSLIVCVSSQLVA